MKRLFVLIVMTLFGVGSVAAQIQKEIGDVLAKKDFVAFKTFADKLSDPKKGISAHWDCLRDVTTNFQEGVFVVADAEPDKTNPAISTVRTFVVRLITTASDIAYYELCEKNYKASGHAWEPSLDTIVTFKNYTSYALFKSSFKDIFHVEMNENELFMTDFVYGDNCGYGGSSPDGRVQINNMVKSRDKSGLLKWLQSPNTEKQVYAVDGLWQLQKLGVKLSPQEVAMINFVKAKKGNMYVCSGCIHYHQEITEVTAAFRFK